MYSNESDVQESRGFDISWMQTIMNGLILWLCMVCHVYHTLHEGWMLSSCKARSIWEKHWCYTRVMSVAVSLYNYFPKMKYVIFNRVTIIVNLRRVQLF